MVSLGSDDFSSCDVDRVKSISALSTHSAVKGLIGT